MGSGDRGVGGREIRGRDAAGGGSGKERGVGILKRRKWENYGENSQQCLISRSQKGLREGSQEKWDGRRENKVRDVLPLFPFPHGFLRVLSKSLLVHALGSKKS